MFFTYAYSRNKYSFLAGRNSLFSQREGALSHSLPALVNLNSIAVVTSDRLEFRPRKSTGLFLAGVLIVTGCIMIWLGFILNPADAEATDGIARLLFTVVPIRWFSWLFGLVFVLMGFQKFRQVFRDAPVLSLTEGGLILETGAVIPWTHIKSVEVSKDDILHIDIVRDRAPPDAESERLPGPRINSRNRPVVLSSFELGEDPKIVAEAIEARRST